MAELPSDHCKCDRDTLADNMATPGCPIHAPELVSYPPLIVYRDDLERLRRYGIRNRLGDSATALRRLLDSQLAPRDHDHDWTLLGPFTALGDLSGTDWYALCLGERRLCDFDNREDAELVLRAVRCDSLAADETQAERNCDG